MEVNRRILVVDDQADLREQVARLLRQSGAVTETQSLIDQIRQRIARPRPSGPENTRPQYQVDTVAQGRDAYERVKAAWSDGEPYSCVFLDMRMPPGWDGLETAQRIRSVDKELQIVIMTAYSDHDQREIVEKLGDPDKLIYLKKPFHPEELRQLALAMTEKWNMNRRENERLVVTNRLMRANAQLRKRCRRPQPEGREAIVHAYSALMETGAVGLVERLSGDKFNVLSSTTEGDDGDLKKALKRLAPGVGQFAAGERGKVGYVPIVANDFTGGVVMIGLNSPLTFQELTPFLEILSETAAEVIQTGIGSEQVVMDLCQGRLLHALRCSRRHTADLAQAIAEAAKHAGENQQAPVDDLDKIQSLAGEISQVFDDYLNLFKLKTEAEAIAEQTSVSELLTAVRNEYAVRCKKAEIDCRWDDGGVKEIPAGAQIALMLHHLVDNAVGAMEIEGSRRGGNHELAVVFTQNAEGVDISVSDTGGGMPDEVSKGYGSNAPGAPSVGRGLGARLVVLVANRLGGRVLVDNHANDRGSVVTVTLPATNSSEGAQI